MEHTGDLIADLIIPDDDLEVTGTETRFLALAKVSLKSIRRIKFY